MLIHGDNLLALKALESKFAGQVKCIYIDPPYKSGAGVEALKCIAARNLLNTGGVAVLESDKPFSGEIENLVRYDERKYGITYLTFFSPD